MRGEKNSHDGPLYPRFVNFDPHDPPPCFSKAQIDYLRSADNFLSDDEAKFVHELEQYKVDQFDNVAYGRELPSLRPSDSRVVLYIENNIGLSYEKFAERFLTRVLGPDFDIASHKFIKSGFRVQTPDKKKYYAFHFSNNQGGWIEKMQAACIYFAAETACFAKGLFVVSSGDVFPFRSLKIDYAAEEIAEDW